MTVAHDGAALLRFASSKKGGPVPAGWKCSCSGGSIMAAAPRAPWLVHGGARERVLTLHSTRAIGTPAGMRSCRQRGTAASARRRSR